MPRIVKPPEERRAELLDCAQELFFARGYDATTINDVIGRTRISKGAFYHYFTSKEELLEALADRWARASIAQVQGILDDPSLDALARLNAFLAKGRRLKVEWAPMLRAMFDPILRPENILLYHRIQAAVVAVVTPVLAKIIAQGIEGGIFRTPDPEATAEMVLQIGAGTHDILARAIAAATEAELAEAADVLQRRLVFQGVAIDRILGLPDGSVDYVEPGFALAILSARPQPVPSTLPRADVPGRCQPEREGSLEFKSAAAAEAAGYRRAGDCE